MIVGWIRNRVFPLAVLLTAACLYWAKTLSETPERFPDRRPSVLGLPGLRPAEEAADAAAERIVERDGRATESFDSLLVKLRAIRPGDGARLDRLFAEASLVARRRPEAMAAELKALLPRFEKLPVREALFLTKVTVDDLPLRSGAVTALLSARPRRATKEAHHGSSSLNLVKTFALDRLRGKELDRETAGALMPALTELAEREPDLAVARQAALLVVSRRLVPAPRAWLGAVMRARPERDRVAFADL